MGETNVCVFLILWFILVVKSLQITLPNKGMNLTGPKDGYVTISSPVFSCCLRFFFFRCFWCYFGLRYMVPVPDYLVFGVQRTRERSHIMCPGQLVQLYTVLDIFIFQLSKMHLVVSWRQKSFICHGSNG